VRPADRPPPDSLDPAYLAELRRIGLEAGLDRFGVTDASVLDRARAAIDHRLTTGLADTMGFTFRNPERSTDPGRAVRDARSVIVGALSYQVGEEIDASSSVRNPSAVMPSEVVPADGVRADGVRADGVSADGVSADGVTARVARYARADFYGPLRSALREVARKLRSDGFRAVVFADENDLVDREVAWRAGLGWFGKNANLLLPGAGSWFVLGSVVTTAELPVAATPAPDGCGTCRACFDACPTGAIVADGVIDARRCLAWLVQRTGIFPFEHRVALHDRIYGCDDCQDSCPPTVRLGGRHRTDVAVDPAIDALELLEADDARVLEICDRWYIAGRDPRWIRRNALLVVANVAPTPVNDRVRAVLRRYLVGDDRLLQAHALWAAIRLGVADDAVRLCDLDDHQVADEWRRRDRVPVRIV